MLASRLDHLPSISIYCTAQTSYSIFLDRAIVVNYTVDASRLFIHPRSSLTVLRLRRTHLQYSSVQYSTLAK